MLPCILIPSVHKSIQIFLLLQNTASGLKYRRRTPETMIGYSKKLQAFIAVSKALPRYGVGLLPTRHH